MRHCFWPSSRGADTRWASLLMLLLRLLMLMLMLRLLIVWGSAGGMPFGLVVLKDA